MALAGQSGRAGGARRDWWLLGTSAAIVALVAAAYGSALAYPFEASTTT